MEKLICADGFIPRLSKEEDVVFIAFFNNLVTGRQNIHYGKFGKLSRCLPPVACDEISHISLSLFNALSR